MKNWQRYERAMFNELYYMYRPPRFVVKPDARDVVGLLSQEIRQIDVAVFEQGDTVRPFLSVECKRYKRKLNIKDVEAFISMRDDIGPKHAILVCPTGFSKGATLRARAANIILRTLTLEEEERLNLREIARQVFPWDETFHPVIYRPVLNIETEVFRRRLVVRLWIVPVVNHGPMLSLHLKFL